MKIRKKMALGELPTRPMFLAVSAVSAVFLQITDRAMGAPDVWTANNGNWATAANWNGGAGPVPGNGDVADIPNLVGTTNRTITYNYTGSAVTLDTVDIGDIVSTQPVVGAVTLSMTANDTLSSENEIVGDYRNGEGVFNQSNGTNNVNTLLYVANSGTGLYSLSGTGTLSAENGEYIGDGGIGTLNQAGGTNTVLEPGGIEAVGYSSDGTYIQSGGLNNMGNPAGDLILGFNAGITGTYSLSGTGQIVNINEEVIGQSGDGSFIQTGGTNAIYNSFFELGQQSGSNGFYSLSTGSLIVTDGGAEFIGGFIPGLGNGTFIQSGGLHQVGEVGDEIGSSIGTGGNGLYSLSGTGAFTVAGQEIVGTTGTFIQSGGTNTISQALDLTGAYTLSGGQLMAGEEPSEDANYGEYIDGTFSQSGGTNTIVSSQSLHLGETSSTGIYLLSAGALSISGDQLVGDGGTGIFSLSATGSLAVSGTEYVGNSGNGTFTQTGGANTVGTTLSSTNLYVGYNTGSNGLFSLSGTGALQDYGIEVIGTAGSGTFIQTGGTNTVVSPTSAAFLSVASESGSTGLYSLGGTGSLQITNGEEDIGVNGSGTFTQSGGTNTIGSGWSLNIGYNPGSFGIYNLSGGSVVFNFFTSGVYVGGSSNGQGGQAALNVSGTGNLTLPGVLEIYPESAVIQTGGTISAGSTVNLGAIQVTGGTATLGPLTGAGSLIVGRSSGSSGTVTASGLNQFSVNVNSTGLLKINGGSANSVDILTINGNGKLDLTNHHLFIDYNDGNGVDPIATISGYLASGYAGGAWNGPGIDSSSAALPANSHYGLGYADGADGIVAGLTSGQVEVMYTLYGDANLDGVVNGSDFTILAGSLGKAVSGWDKADFNYDGVVNATDFTLLAGNLGKSASGAAVEIPASDYAAIDAFAAANGLMADVPEPASAGLLLAAGFGFMARRRRSASSTVPQRCSSRQTNLPGAIVEIVA
jgi:Dockerin type I domain